MYVKKIDKTWNEIVIVNNICRKVIMALLHRLHSKPCFINHSSMLQSSIKISNKWNMLASYGTHIYMYNEQCTQPEDCHYNNLLSSNSSTSKRTSPLIPCTILQDLDFFPEHPYFELLRVSGPFALLPVRPNTRSP